MSNWCLNSLTSVCYNCQRKCSLLNPKKSEAIWNFVVTETWINGSFCIWPFPQLWISENKGSWASCSLGNWNYAPLCIRSYLFIIVFTCSHWTNWCLLEFKRYRALVEALFLMIFTWWWMLPFSSSGGGWGIWWMTLCPWWCFIFISVRAMMRNGTAYCCRHSFVSPHPIQWFSRLGTHKDDGRQKWCLLRLLGLRPLSLSRHHAWYRHCGLEALFLCTFCGLLMESISVFKKESDKD